METKYIVKVEAAEGCNEEYAPDSKLREGLEASGFVIMLFDKDGEPTFGGISGVSIMGVAKLIASDEAGVGLELRQAACIAEGILKADEIDKEDRRKKREKTIANMKDMSFSDLMEMLRKGP